MPYTRFCVVFSFALLIFCPSFSTAQRTDAAVRRRIDPSLHEAARQRGGRVQVIVATQPGRRGEIRRALEAHGDVIRSESRLIDVIAVEVHREDIERLASHPWVDFVAEDAVVYVSAQEAERKASAGRETPATKNVGKGTTKARKGARAGDDSRGVPASTLRATLGLSGTTPTGLGVGVAIIDSGIAPLADFAGRISAFYDFTRGGRAVAPYDDFGHGTHLAGLIGSSGVQSSGALTGVSPEVHFVGLKVLDHNGEGRASSVIEAIDFLIANKDRLRVQVVNISLGHSTTVPAKDDPLVRAVEQATDAGLIVVVAAGNGGVDRETGEPVHASISSPGNAPSAITVGAADTKQTTSREDDVAAAYSSKGPTWLDGFGKPDLVAPGHRLASNITRSSHLYRLVNKKPKASWTSSEAKFDHIIWGTSDGDFLTLSGSSMAAAVTSGVVATLLQASSLQAGHAAPARLTPNTVKAILQFTAIPLAGTDYLTQGTGEVNAIGAIALAGAVDASVSSGGWWLTTGVHPVSEIGGEPYDWSQRVIWGDDVYEGELVYHNAPGWALTAQWGDDNIVWGTFGSLLDDNIVWGTADVWASSVGRDRVIGQRIDDNIVWGTDDNIVWGTFGLDNIVWGTFLGDNIVWGTWNVDNIIWGTTRHDGDGVIWGARDDMITRGTDGVRIR